MRFLKNLHSIDILLFVTFLPLFFILPVFMKIYAIVGLYFVYKKRLFPIALLGGISILISFYDLAEIKNFEVYLQFLASLLLWAVYMQRVKGENFYLKLSPYLFFGMGIVAFQNIYMLFYALFEIFIFLYLNVKQYSNFPLKVATLIFLSSIPMVVVLFLFFPRTSQQHFIFGFSSKSVKSGFSKVVNSNSKDLKPTSYPVVEFKLNKDYGKLYLRGGVFYNNINGVWVRGYGRDELVSFSQMIKYYLKEYPTNSKVIFGVDLPLKSDYGINVDFILLSLKSIKKPLFVKVTSALKYKLKPYRLREDMFLYDKRFNKKAQIIAKELRKIKDERKRLQKLIEIFKSQKIVYSLKVGDVDGKNIVDWIFEHKKGYCTHLASAFALFARMAGLGSRLVGGYLVSGKNGFYKAYTKDAHVWDEILVNGFWVRVDPVEFVYKVDRKTKEVLTTPTLSTYLSMVRFMIETWILRYNKKTQKRFLESLKNNLISYLVGFLGFVLIIYIAVKRIYKKRDILEPLYKKLGKRPNKESVYRFLKSFNDKKLDEINELYYKITYYKSSKEDIKRLKRLIKEYK
ncbi:MAG: DUF3488 and transglutaminase-like domain-containing protein [Nautiliaceae bacterium]